MKLSHILAATIAAPMLSSCAPTEQTNLILCKDVHDSGPTHVCDGTNINGFVINFSAESQPSLTLEETEGLRTFLQENKSSPLVVYATAGVCTYENDIARKKAHADYVAGQRSEFMLSFIANNGVKPERIMTDSYSVMVDCNGSYEPYARRALVAVNDKYTPTN
jgi:hypothetical protein